MHTRAFPIAAGLLATLLTTAAVAGGGARPDLAVKRVTPAETIVQPGEGLEVAVTVGNRGGRAGRSQLRVLLSRDAKPSRGDMLLRGRPAVGPLPGGGARRLAATLNLPASAPQGNVRLVACADAAGRLRERSEGNNCGASQPLTVTAAPEAAPPAPASPAAPPAGEPSLANLNPSSDPPPSPGSGARMVSGRVLYTKRECTDGPASLAPLAGATVQLTAGPVEPVIAPLDGQGRFTAEVPGDAPIHVTAITDGPRVAVMPDTSPARPYEIPLGTLTTPDQTFHIGAGPGNTLADPSSGAANIYTVLDLGARVGQAASPATLPKVQARWRYAGDLDTWLGDETPSYYDDSGTNAIYVGGTRHQGRRDEWPAFPLLHEYGHHVLKYVANPAGAIGDHGFDSVHVANPALPWSEGFSNAFAAIAQGNPRLTLGCETYMDLGTKPASARPGFRIPRPSRPELAPMPPAGSEHLAQYNETAIAGAVWSTVHELGSNVPTAGLSPLLRALKAFRDKYHAPRDMREVRDALTEFAVGGSEMLEQGIGNAFDDHRLRWGFHLEEVSQVKNGLGTGWVVPWATGSSCDMSAAGWLDPLPGPGDTFFAGPIGTTSTGVRNHYGRAVVSGTLGHTRHDECWQTIRGAWLDANASVTYSLIGTLPYLPDQAHRRGRTVIGLVFRCVASDVCASSSRTVTVRVGTGVWHRPNGQTHLDSAQALNPKTVTVTVPAVVGEPAAHQIVPVAEVDAAGYCITRAGPAQDCSS